MKITIRTKGFKEIEQALKGIEKKATAKVVMRRSLIKAAKPVADKAQAMAPKGPKPELSPSVGVSTKLSKRQKKLHRKAFRSDKASVEVFVGAGPLSSAHNQEFGNENHVAQPFLRPAWDAEGRATLDRLGDEMWRQIEAQARRTAKKNGWEV
ncbi:HK97 gp10 family phage protein [Falsigemmobacter faecalis]|uniref:HK97 gp10 family phage protein n=1 Tax=Falsigemmobacter faecalis TaxID=2488730 RepID=A0A3P3DCD2_9RHOB|nr:HK97 gp10 family phage protein [Falsigemmobacter faecalis]RRH71997.1 HK97 gp10 family phage protein [Falsigemmobacter faecalis]